MDCPCGPGCANYVHRPRVRVSAWAPLALIVAVLGTAALASAMTDAREPVARAGTAAIHGRAL